MEEFAHTSLKAYIITRRMLNELGDYHRRTQVQENYLLVKDAYEKMQRDKAQEQEERDAQQVTHTS